MLKFRLAVQLAETSARYPIDVSTVIEVLSYAAIPVLLYWQLRKRIVKVRLLRSALLIAVGVLDLANHAERHPVSGRDVLLVTASIVILGIGLGVVRAHTIRLWREDSVVYRQGTMITAILWLLAVGLHLTADHFASTGSASLLLYLGVTMAAQRIVLRRRVSGISPSVTEEVAGEA